MRAFEYDAANRLAFERWYDPDGALVRTITSAYEVAGNLRSPSDPDGTRTWTYDSLNRVKTESNPGTPGVPAVTLTYTYDTLGNVASATDNFGVQVASTYDARLPDESFHSDANGNRDSAGYMVGRGNPVLADGTSTYAYDKEGNLIRKSETATGSVTEYTYDHRNRLVHAEERSAGGIVLGDSRYHDVLGLRIALVENGIVTKTVYNGPNAWAEFNTAGVVTA